MRCIVQFSGGGASYMAAKLAVEEFGRENTVLLFADTRMEDNDLYRFNADVEKALGISITRLCEGRTPWQVFFDEGMIGNTRADLCSRILKREVLDAWRVANTTPDDAVIFVGMDANEAHRLAGVQRRLAPWIVRSPLVERGIWKEHVLAQIEADGIKLPRLYKLGFAHNNCGGFCIKAGQGHFALLLETLPGRYLGHEQAEEQFRQETGKDVAILRDRRGGDTKPLTLRALRERLEAAPEDVDRFDIGGCGCLEPAE